MKRMTGRRPSRSRRLIVSVEQCIISATSRRERSSRKFGFGSDMTRNYGPFFDGSDSAHAFARNFRFPALIPAMGADLREKNADSAHRFWRCFRLFPLTDFKSVKHACDGHAPWRSPRVNLQAVLVSCTGKVSKKCPSRLSSLPSCGAPPCRKFLSSIRLIWSRQSGSNR